MKFDKLYESFVVNEGPFFKGLRKFLKGKYMSGVKLDPRFDAGKASRRKLQPMDKPLLDVDMKKTLSQIKTDTNKAASFSKASDAVLKSKFPPPKKGGYTNQSPRSKQTQPGTGINESFGPLAKWYRKLMQQGKVKKAFGNQAPNRKVQLLPGRNIDRGFKDQITNFKPKYNPEQRPLDIPHDVPFVGPSKGDVRVNTKIKFGPGKFSKHRTQTDVPYGQFRKIPPSKTIKESFGPLAKLYSKLLTKVKLGTLTPGRLDTIPTKAKLPSPYVSPSKSKIKKFNLKDPPVNESFGKIGSVLQRWIRRTRASGPGTSGPIQKIKPIHKVNPKKPDEYRLPIDNQIHHKADRLPVKR
jgi:hypothetical protein